MTKRIKVLHVTFDMRIGGTEQVIKNLIEGSDKSHYDMSIFCLEQPVGPFGIMLQEKGTDITSVNREPGFDTSLIRHIRRHVKDHDIDIIHCHQYTPWVYGTLASIGTGAKVVFTEHGRFYPDSSSWKRRYINPLLALFTDEITAISNATRQALIDYEYIGSCRIKVIYNGIVPLTGDNTERDRTRKQLGIPDSSRIIGTVARLDPIKNHRMMLSAFKLVLEKHPDTFLLIVGDGEERKNIENAIEQLGLNGKVIITGYIARPVNHLDCMDVFLLSSLSEGTSMTLLEAMSLAKPCVVTDAGGNPEIIADDINGLVTENGNAEAFASAIINLLADDAKRNAMASASLDRYNKKFSAAVMADAYHELYMSL